MQEGEEMLTLKEVCARLEKSRSTVDRMIAQRKLVGVKVGSGRGQWRFKASEVDALLHGEPS